MTQAQRQLIDRLADRLQAEIVADPEAEYLLSNQEASRLIRYIKGVLRKKSADRAMAIPRGPQGEEVLFFARTRNGQEPNTVFTDHFQELLQLGQQYRMPIRMVQHATYAEIVTVYDAYNTPTQKRNAWHAAASRILQVLRMVQAFRRLTQEYQAMIAESPDDFERFELQHEYQRKVEQMKVVVD